MAAAQAASRWTQAHKPRAPGRRLANDHGSCGNLADRLIVCFGLLAFPRLATLFDEEDDNRVRVDGACNTKMASLIRSHTSCPL